MACREKRTADSGGCAYGSELASVLKRYKSSHQTTVDDTYFTTEELEDGEEKSGRWEDAESEETNLKRQVEQLLKEKTAKEAKEVKRQAEETEGIKRRVQVVEEFLKEIAAKQAKEQKKRSRDVTTRLQIPRRSEGKENKEGKATCSKCKRQTMTVSRKGACHPCYGKYFRPKITCSRCSREGFRTLAKDTDEGIICRRCRDRENGTYKNWERKPRPDATCTSCKETSPTRMRKGMCNKCYKKHGLTKSACDLCGELRPTRGIVKGKSLCNVCFNREREKPSGACELCAIHTTRLSRDGTWICNACHIDRYVQARKLEPCSNRETETRCHTRLDDGSSLCSNCYYHLGLRPRRACVDCGEEDQVEKMRLLPNGNRVCCKCFTKQSDCLTCTGCGKKGEERGWHDPTAMCSDCHTKRKPLHQCTECGIMAGKGIKGEWRFREDRRMCVKCYNKTRPLEECGFCHKMKQKYRNSKGKSACGGCYQRLELGPNIECSNCHRMAARRGTTDAGPVCRTCYYTLDIQPKRKCDSCGRLAQTQAHTKNGESLCSQCHRPFLCSEPGCPHASNNQSNADAHARVHTAWGGKSTAEETIYKHLIAKGWKEVKCPKRNPTEPPAPKTFWYQVSVFTSLMGVGGRRLQVDFITGPSSDHSTRSWAWEFNGPQHHKIQKWDRDESRLERQKEHDKRKVDFFKETPPWPGVQLRVIE